MAYENNQLKSDHYVYVLQDAEFVVRYVGEGRKARCNQVSGRSAEYLNVVATGGRVRIVQRGLTKVESQKLEKYLIKKYSETILNVQSCTVTKHIAFNMFDDLLYIDPNSFSGLSWKRKVRGSLRKEAGTVCSNGSYKVNYKSLAYSIPRIIWCLHNKRDLDVNLVVYHIDGDLSNNSPANLEAVSRQELRGIRPRPTSSELTGIRIHPKRGKPNARLIITFYKNDMAFSREFSLNKYTYETAIHLAQTWKVNKLKELENVQLLVAC